MENIRYTELKYEGKTYTQKYQIDEILLDKGLNWFLDAEIENVRIEIMKDTLIINGGIWYNGIWEYGVIRDVDWRAGTFQNGVIYNGTFKRIKVEKGIIFDGTFIRGDVLFADIRGGEFKDVDISNNVNQTTQEETPIEEEFKPQPETTQPQKTQAQPVQVQGEVPQGQEGQEIQAQVQESRYIKTFESFLGGKTIIPISKENFYKSKWYYMLSKPPYSEKFTDKFLEDIKDIETNIDDVVLFLSKIFRHYDYEPGREQYKIELDRFLDDASYKNNK